MYLNCHTYYSFRFGTFSEEVLLQLARHHGVTSMALTDINNTSACLNFTRLASKYNISPILGIDFRNEADQLYVGLAKNNTGFLELNEFLSLYTHSKKDLPAQAPEFQHAVVIYPFKKALLLNKDHFTPQEFIGVSANELSQLRFSKLAKFKDRLVVFHSVTFRDKRDFNAHRLLRAIDKNILLSRLSKNEEAEEHEKMVPLGELKTLFSSVPHIWYNTEKLIEECGIQFDFSAQRTPQNQKNYLDSPAEDRALLHKLSHQGLAYRYGTTPSSTVMDRLNMELEIIEKMGFVSYFLINWDIIRYAKRKGYFHVGRGSGANSIVAYLLSITDVDPVELDLYFERFINLYRTNPPDFDLDFSWRDRQDITRYIFERFDNVALLGAYNTFQTKAVTRELGKVMGLPPHEIDQLAFSQRADHQLDNISRLVRKYSTYIHGFPNHLSIHAGGILISEKPIHYYSATEMPPKGFPTVQFDMIVAEDVGLFKFDILGQRGLAKISEAVDIVGKNQPNEPKIDIYDVKRFKEDPKVKALIRSARCLGCFYVESPAMRMLLKKLEVDSYLGLVAASSIIRPGVAKSGMMREYILRHRYPEKIKDAHPILLNIMPDTYGVMVYQEDVIKVAHHFAGLTLGEADVLRRGMSGKYRSREEFLKVKNKFFENCIQKGYAQETVVDVWRQVESFAGYAFAKGHSASYAVESYQSLFLKAYYPLEYMVAVINNGGGFYRQETYVHEARMLGAQIHAPCVNKSFNHTVIYDRDIYLGFQHLNELEGASAKLIVRDRSAHGVYQDFNDFVKRVPLSLTQISLLIRIDAFRFTGKNKRALLWEAHFKLTKEPRRYEQKQLFEAPVVEFDLPQLSTSAIEDAFDQIELLGYSLGNPFQLLLDPIHNDHLAEHMNTFLNREMTLLGHLVSVKNTRTSKGDRMNFGTFLDQAGYFFDTVHFPKVSAQFPFRGKGVYAVTGKVVEEFGFVSLEVSKLEKLAYMPDPRYVD